MAPNASQQSHQSGKPLCIWAISDDKPGHVNQTLGLIQSLLKYRQGVVVNKPVLTRSQALAMLLCKRCHALEEGADKPDLIIGTGHGTHLSLLAYRRCYGGRAVVLMSPSLPARWFDLCLIPRHDNPAQGPHIIETLGPLNRVEASLEQQKNQGLILLGGPSKHVNWESDKVLLQIQQLLANKALLWTIASSRRTPETFMQKLKEQFPDLELVLPDHVPSNWLVEKMAQVGQIWVTADSMSMLFEAMSSGALTGVIQLPSKQASRVTQEVNRLIREGRLLTNPLDLDQSERHPEPLAESDRCAQIVIEKCGL